MAAIHFIDGSWTEGNPPILGPMDHAGRSIEVEEIDWIARIVWASQ